MSTSHNRAMLDLSRAESWVIHDSLLARIERETAAGNEVDREVALLRAVESDEFDFDQAELDLIRSALSTYLADAPGRDRAPGQAVLDEIEVTLA